MLIVCSVLFTALITSAIEALKIQFFVLKSIFGVIAMTTEKEDKTMQTVKMGKQNQKHVITLCRTHTEGYCVCICLMLISEIVSWYPWP